MRKPRIKLKDRTAVYHCTSRVVGGQFLLDNNAKEHLRRMLKQQADFCGLQVITHSELSNHFHIEIRVPRSAAEVADGELVRRAGVLYPSNSGLLRLLRRTFAEHGTLPVDLRDRLKRRMGDVSVFMKELKQRFSRWFNRVHDRFGTLWAERFRSVLVEDCSAVVGIVAAYIDLNAVRAGLVDDPKDYRFCGYGEAAAGDARARMGLLSFLGATDWAAGGAAYRRQLFITAGTGGGYGKVVLDRSQILQVLARGGQIGIAEALRLRIRYFRDGLVLGSADYVESVFHQFRRYFGSKRKTGARALRGLPFGDLRTLRDLRKKVVS